jgi:hypothetical protein
MIIIVATISKINNLASKICLFEMRFQIGTTGAMTENFTFLRSKIILGGSKRVLDKHFKLK